MQKKTAFITALGPIPDHFWPQLKEDALGYQTFQMADRGFTHTVTDFNLNDLPTGFFLHPLSFAARLPWPGKEAYYVAITEGMKDAAIFGYGKDPAQLALLNDLSKTCHYYGLPYQITLYT